jgi:hypothetical protein
MFVCFRKRKEIFLHIRLAFSLVLPMPEISSGMGVPDESRAKQQRHFSALYEPSF